MQPSLDYVLKYNKKGWLKTSKNIRKCRSDLSIFEIIVFGWFVLNTHYRENPYYAIKILLAFIQFIFTNEREKIFDFDRYSNQTVRESFYQVQDSNFFMKILCVFDVATIFWYHLWFQMTPPIYIPISIICFMFHKLIEIRCLRKFMKKTKVLEKIIHNKINKTNGENTKLTKKKINTNQYNTRKKCDFIKNGKQCDICITSYMKKDQVRILDCLHHYHTECINNWLSIKPRCPMCQKVVFST
jgi:hypothetical protein